MATAYNVLKIASKEIGIKESPPNSNCVKYNDWYYGRKVSGEEFKWCMVFCQWVYNQAKVRLPTRTTSCTMLMNVAKAEGSWVTKNFKPGDLVIFTFNKERKPQHCGIVRSDTGSSIVSIEGNTGTSNDDNGGMVMERVRAKSTILGAFRPKFEEEIEMTIPEMINTMTDKQAYDLLTKATKYASTLKEPSWSQKEGHWAKAKAKKIVDGSEPEGFVKRDVLVAILGRLGLL